MMYACVAVVCLYDLAHTICLPVSLYACVPGKRSPPPFLRHEWGSKDELCETSPCQNWHSAQEPILSCDYGNGKVPVYIRTSALLISVRLPVGRCYGMVGAQPNRLVLTPRFFILLICWMFVAPRYRDPSSCISS